MSQTFKSEELTSESRGEETTTVGKNKNAFFYLVIIFLITTNLVTLYPLHSYRQSVLLLNDSYLKFKDITDSAEYVSFLEGKVIPKTIVKDIAKTDSTNEPLLEIYKSPVVMCTLLSTVGCTVCLDDEMRRIENFYQWVKSNNLPVAVCGIANSSSRETLTRFKRASGFTFPLFIDQNDTISKHFHLKAFPVTLLIDSRSMIILKATHPVKNRWNGLNIFIHLQKICSIVTSSKIEGQ